MPVAHQPNLTESSRAGIGNAPCPRCGGSRTTIVATSWGSIGRCHACDLVSLAPQMTAPQRFDLYQRDYFGTDNPAAPGYLADDALDRALRVAARRQMRVVRRLPAPGSRVLDVGCGTGVFLDAARSAGWSAVGYDLSEAAAQDARARGHDVRVGEFPQDAPAGPFDVITMWDVIEHFPKPVSALRGVFDRLSPGGFYVACTPSVARWDARVFGRAWYGYTKVPEHLFYYAPDTLSRDVRDAGLEVVAVRRWGLVRSVGYVLAKVGARSRALDPLLVLARKAGLDHRVLYWPSTELLLIARK